MMIWKLLILVSVLAVPAAALHVAAGRDGVVAYGNTRFNAQGLDFATGVTHKSLKDSPLKPDSPPGDEWPAHIEFTFPHYFDGKLGKLVDPAAGEQPLLAIYPTAHFAALQWEGELKSLKALLKKRSGGNRVLAAAHSLPYLPMAEAAQMLHAGAVYLSFRNGTGIRYITHYAQDVSPYTAASFFYTYQGLTRDGKTYVSATFPLYTSLFPRRIPDRFDYKTFGKQEARYRAAGVKKLNAADLNKDFTPSVALFDRLIASIVIVNDAKPSAQPRTIAPRP